MGVCFSGEGIEMGNSAGSLKNHIATAEKTGALNFTEKKGGNSKRKKMLQCLLEKQLDSILILSFLN